MTARRARGEAGTVTAFVVCFTVALIAVAGLVVDGGSIAACRHAFEDADAAARAGAQAIDEATLRDGEPVSLDPVRGGSSTRKRQLQASGESGTVVVNRDEVTVTIGRVQPLSILGFAGLSSVTIPRVGNGARRPWRQRGWRLIGWRR